MDTILHKAWICGVRVRVCKELLYYVSPRGEVEVWHCLPHRLMRGLSGKQTSIQCLLPIGCELQPSPTAQPHHLLSSDPSTSGAIGRTQVTLSLPLSGIPTLCTLFLVYPLANFWGYKCLPH